eukprot:scaffold4329_cov115-Cylindrotheca_fusiformis.AAC.7
MEGNKPSHQRLSILGLDTCWKRSQVYNMGRKKKAGQKGKDARGYFQGAPQNNQQQSQSKSVSSNTHNDIKILLDQLDGENGTGTEITAVTSAAPSDRFFSRLSNVVEQLEVLGFTDSHIERVVVAQKYEITLESALDWLCLNLNTMELPAVLTDGRLRDSLSTATTSESLTVLKAAPQASGDSSGPPDKADNILKVATPTDKTKEIIDTAEKERELQKRERERREEEEHKKILLKQYEFEEVEDDTGEDEQPEVPDENVGAPALSTEEQYLAEEEEKLHLLEADLRNDANNYMRSKQEIKQLQNQAKKLRQQIGGLRRKVERSKAQRKQKEKEEEALDVTCSANNEDDPGTEEVNEEEYGGGLFDMLGEEKDEGETEADASEELPTGTRRLDFPIPKGWTGTTPQNKLEEVCKKRKMPKPKYTKLPRNEGFRLTATIKKKAPKQEWEAKTGEFESGSSVKDYLATKALYEIEPSLPLYQVFPPAFRDLWLSWINQLKKGKDKAQKEQDNAKQQRLDRLVAMISDQPTPAKELTAAQKDNPQHNSLQLNTSFETPASESWEEQDADVMSGVLGATASTKGIQMKKEFVKRQSSPSYRKMKKVRENLPMHTYRQEVLELVQKNPVTILCAETGAGKTTQCPQYILEQALLDGRGDSVEILCTQPRRVAAVSVAERVADEMCDSLGSTVGYHIRMESRRSAATRLLFCTTGVVLRRLQEDSNLRGITHVVVDEVHERQQQIDVLLVILRQLLGTTRPDLKMSATMDASLFCSFFHNAPIISVPGRTFPVSDYYLEDLMDATDHVIEEGSRYAKREERKEQNASLWVTGRGGEKHREVVDLASQVELAEVSMYPGYKMSTRRSMERVNEEVVNYDLVEDLLVLLLLEQDRNTALLAPQGADLSSGSVLIFLPGLGEIKALTEQLEGNRLLGNRQRFTIIPLHSTLSSRDQRQAFVPARSGCRKIILSTNIAETSVTIPDVVCVIDTGRVREVRRNKKTSTTILATDWCSKASAKQRAGRAGRVQPGLCLKLYSSRTAENFMKPNSEPELRRVPLEEVCLGILAGGFAKSCMAFLSQAPQPPEKESVHAAINVLHDVGAIERPSEGMDAAQQFERLTPLGQHLAKLPVDVHLGKMLIYGALFQCIDPILTIAASMSSQSPFSTFVKDAAVAKGKQKAFADQDSDFATLVNVYEAYAKAAATSTSTGRKFCHSNYLNHVALREIGEARRQFLDLLCGIGFLDRRIVLEKGNRINVTSLQSCRFNRYASKPELVHAVICAGLFPHVARLEEPAAGTYSLWHKEERLYFHSSSVNAKKKSFSGSHGWVVFHEKFGTPNRISVSTTCFVNPFALLLFGGTVDVKYLQRMVVIDDWIEVRMAAQIGVILRELRKKLDILLQKMIEQPDTNEIDKFDSTVIEGIVNILES